MKKSGGKLVSLSRVENPPERGEVLNREDRGMKPGGAGCSGDTHKL